MTHYFIIPGLGNSGPDHWQTHFEKSGDQFIRINQQDWDTPASKDWIETINQALVGYDLANVILIGHSLGCTAIANWAKQYQKEIKGALLVAPSDLEAPRYNFPTVGFDHVPLDKINFKSIVVASSNDEWVTIERAEFFAQNWGSEFINIGNAGHINADAGFGVWPEGLEILKKLG
ncbi:putative alpha/beta hydrolase family esterase [Pedobacter sp. W3I1]|uniref:RBBP9/YdeN family alpha/beta hydrolase n=1 Tax=Pedobacter sp. W3I1 TaxID=3042291 RepID=UPI00278433E2|nr:alpha/beta fold hydrolase [Pedobacter sp. W3I1]MDQ0636648.1 putative alpha/beta hydrolase family esterase [Pedobacter sp. W3I1]